MSSGRNWSDVLAATRGVKYEHLVAGVSGGVVSTLLLHPLDLLKIRFAVDDGQAKNRPKYAGLNHALKLIFRQEGLSGLYKGITPNVTGAGVAWGFYFFFYNTIKSGMQNGNSKTRLPATKSMLAAAQAGVLTLVITNPIWVIKTRLCLQYGTAPSNATYHGMIDAFVKISKSEGIRGLYKGFVPGLFGVSHGAIQFMVYEQMRANYTTYQNRPIDSKLGSSEYIIFAAISKLVAALVTYPYQVVRARLQDQQSDYKGTYDCVTKIMRNEGFLGFYKGLKPNLMRVVPATAITFVVYEHVSHALISMRAENVFEETSNKRD